MLRKDGSDYFPCTRPISKLAEIDALPGAEVQPVICDRQSHGAARQHSLDMGRHIIGAFIIMGVVFFSFYHYPVEGGFEIIQDGGIGIFIDGECS